MKVMRFSEKQKEVSCYKLDNEYTDVVICLNEREITEEEPESNTTAVIYEYDGNIFRTYSLTTEQITAEPEKYLDYTGDDAPSSEMVDYANQMIDEYTAQLMDEGLI